jgi:hypothetical protein
LRRVSGSERRFFWARYVPNKVKTVIATTSELRVMVFTVLKMPLPRYDAD